MSAASASQLATTLLQRLLMSVVAVVVVFVFRLVAIGYRCDMISVCHSWTQFEALLEHGVVLTAT